MVVESSNTLPAGYYLPRSISTSAKPLKIEPNTMHARHDNGTPI